MLKSTAPCRLNPYVCRNYNPSAELVLAASESWLAARRSTLDWPPKPGERPCDLRYRIEVAIQDLDAQHASNVVMVLDAEPPRPLT